MTVDTASATPVAPLAGPVLSNMLLGEDEFVEPVHLLRDLTGDLAVAHPAEVTESIAQIVAHMHYFQHRNLAVIRGESLPAADHDEVTFREIPPEHWQNLVSEFLADLDELMAVTESDTEIVREVGDDETVGDRIRWSAVHNAYHYGQIVLLRRLLGAWPPEGGENTW
jgi:uncharacterized damage-inducible protein DinB